MRPDESAPSTDGSTRNKGGPGKLSLLVMSKAGVFTTPLPQEGEVRLGRAEECEVSIPDSKVSRVHAVVRVSADGVHLLDLRSRNGTTIGGRKVDPSKPISLALGDMITLGSTVLVLQAVTTQGAPIRVWSQAAFDGKLEDEYWRGQKNGTSFAVVQIRIHRHDDKALATSATSNTDFDVSRIEQLELCFRNALRAADVVASFAMGVYKVLMPDTGPDVAQALATQLQHALRARRFECEIGVTAYPRDRTGRDGKAPEVDARIASALSPRDEQLDHGVMQRLAPTIERLAAGIINVLILGETGVGKEVLARTLHERSPRARAPMLCLNCAALSESLLESELFGYERGAFTGATQPKAGLLESADRGTVFLDEIGEMPFALQAKLLRVLEQREVQRVGSLRPRPIDVRFVSATNRNLDEEIAAGRFRQDLFFRLNGISVLIPPLRERTDEIEHLALAFIRQACAESRRRPPALSPSVLALLKTYAWPGNIRELRNMMERAVVLCAGDVIAREHLPAERFGPLTPSLVPKSSSPPSDAARAFGPIDAGDMPTEIGARENDDERARIVRALQSCAGNQTQAAKLLGISRRTLVSRLGEYALPRPRKRAGD